MINNWKKYLNEDRLRSSSVDKVRTTLSNLDARNAFESDFGRVVFSSASRRLHDKTQVFPLTDDDNIHSRLTHSLEVMNIGLSFAIYLSENKSFLSATGLSSIEVMRLINPILKTSCLVHDIGNPPFGHFGEVVFQEYFKKLFCDLHALLNNKSTEDKVANAIWTEINNETNGEKKNQRLKDLEGFLCNANLQLDYTGFDGNAEGFRVLTKLQYLGDLYGLNLTIGTLASTLKYPNLGIGNSNDKLIAKHKHGVFQTEKDALERIAVSTGMLKVEGAFARHPLAFLMEAADSICYYTMDLEDAHGKGWITYDTIYNAIKDSTEVSQESKNKIFSNLKVNSNDSSLEKKKFVGLRTTLLSYLMEVATNNFVIHLDEIIQGMYQNELIEDSDNVYKVLKSLARNHVLNQRNIISLELTGQAVITGILEHYLLMMFAPSKQVRERAKTMISTSIFKTVLHEHNQYFNPTQQYVDNQKAFDEMDFSDFAIEERFRMCRDFVACMTDKFALSHYQKISGQKI